VPLQYATLANWTSQLTAGGLATPCSATVMNGMFDMGQWPSAALFPMPGNGGSGARAWAAAATVGMAVAHEGLTEGAVDTQDCGIAVAQPGIVLDGWPVAEVFDY
jgi:hypothetical protein